MEMDSESCDCNCTVARYQQRWNDAFDLIVKHIMTWTTVKFCPFPSADHNDKLIQDQGAYFYL